MRFRCLPIGVVPGSMSASVSYSSFFFSIIFVISSFSNFGHDGKSKLEKSYGVEGMTIMRSYWGERNSTEGRKIIFRYFSPLQIKCYANPKILNLLSWWKNKLLTLTPSDGMIWFDIFCKLNQRGRCVDFLSGGGDLQKSKCNSLFLFSSSKVSDEMQNRRTLGIIGSAWISVKGEK